MTRSAIANNIKQFRNSRHWSQEELAVVSGVDVRTIQRAEAGRPVSVDTLKALAAAFDTTIDMLQLPEENILAAVETFYRDYSIVPMHVIQRSVDLGRYLAAADAFLLERIGALTECQLDEIAPFQADLQDYVNIWRDMGPVDQREAEKQLYEMVSTLVSKGMSISFGSENVAIMFAEGSPLRATVLYVAVVSGGVPMQGIARPKNMPIGF